MAKWKKDVIIGICFEVFFLAAYIGSFSIPAGTMANIKAAQPGVYLRLWLIIFAILSLALIVNAIRKHDETPAPVLFHKQAIITLVLLFLYIEVMDKIGFFLSTLVFTTLLILDYSKEAGKFKDKDGNSKKGAALVKSIAFYMVISLIVVVATQFIFEELLMVNLPAWKL